MFPFPVEVPAVSREKPIRRMMAIAMVHAQFLCEDEKGEFHLFETRAVRRAERNRNADRQLHLNALIIAGELEGRSGKALGEYVGERLWTSALTDR